MCKWTVDGLKSMAASPRCFFIVYIDCTTLMKAVVFVVERKITSGATEEVMSMSYIAVRVLY